MPIPARNNILGNCRNKAQLIDLICTEAKSYFSTNPSSNKLMISGGQQSPVEIQDGKMTVRDDLATTHEEADTIIIHNTNVLIKEGYKQCHVLCDDTDVLLLLMHYYESHFSPANIYMVGFKASPKVISISESVKKHSAIVPHLLAGHAPTGCDSVPGTCNIGKTKIVKALNSSRKVSLRSVGTNDLEASYAASFTFMSILFGAKSKNQTVGDLRYEKWKERMASKLQSSSTTWQSLPPTDAALMENLKRAHHIVAQWTNCLSPDLPALEPECFGYKRDTVNKVLRPVPLPPCVDFLPPVLRDLISCKCKAKIPCKTNQCSCRKNGSVCTPLCGCSEEACVNKPQTDDDESDYFSTDDESDDDESDDDDSNDEDI